MKGIIHTEVLCGECKRLMSWHENNQIYCNNLKCKERGVKYHAPMVELVSTVAKKEVKLRGRPTKRSKAAQE